jgi:tetratricopeptide (TPR) repeat protein
MGAGLVEIPVPLNWRRADEDQKPRWIQGLGLKLFGLRTVPFVGRESQREQLWQQLRRVGRAKGATQLVLIRGDTGVGKTRLAEWVCERAHELGVANVLRAIHGVRPGPLRGIRAMVARHLQCVGMDREAVIKRVLELYSNDETVDPDEAEEIAELLSPASQEIRESGIRVIQFERPEEWYGVLERLLHRLAASRPVILSLDDVHWGLDALGFTLYLLRRQVSNPARILILMTVQDENLPDDSIEAMWLRELQGDERTLVVQLQPLSPEEQAQLTRVALGLVPVLAEQIDRKARGVPLYAIQLVSQWAEEGRLVGGGRGFKFREEAARELPETLAAIWRERVRVFLDQRSETDALVLELASALGEDGVETELEQVCNRVGLSISDDLIDDLVAHRLARRFGDGGDWLFSSGMIHEVLEARAVEGGRWRSHHRSCAEVLGTGRHLEERCARHLVLAGDEEQALEPLLDAVQERTRGGEIIVARRILDQFHEAASACELHESDPRWGRALLSESIVARAFADFDRSLEKALKLEQLASSHGWNVLLGAAKLSRANHHQDHFQVSAARPLYREALALFRAEGSSSGWEVSTWNNLGFSHAYSGEHDAAQRCFESALDRATALADFRGLALAHEGLSSLAISRADIADALVHAEKALELGRQAGSRTVEARALLLFGDALRLDGDPERAEAHYRSSCEILDSIGAALVTIAEAHVAWALMEQERYQEALPMVREQVLVFRAEKRDHFVATSECCLMVCAAVDMDWNAWWEHLIDAEQLLIDTGFVDFTCARLVARAAAYAGKAGRNSDARRAYALALSIWEKLGWEDEIAQTHEQLEQLR